MLNTAKKIDTLELVVSTALAGVVALSGVEKLIDPGPAMMFFKYGFDMRAVWTEPIIYAIAIMEIAAAAALLLGIGRWRWPALANLLLAAMFLGMVIAFRWRHPHYGISCGGIGELQAPLGGDSLLGLFRLNMAVGAALVWVLFIQDHRNFFEGRGKLAPNPSTALARD